MFWLASESEPVNMINRKFLNILTDHTVIFVYMQCILIVYYLYQQIHIFVYITALNYITNAPTCFNASAPSSGSFDIAFAEVKQY